MYVPVESAFFFFIQEIDHFSRINILSEFHLHLSGHMPPLGPGENGEMNILKL